MRPELDVDLDALLAVAAGRRAGRVPFSMVGSFGADQADQLPVRVVGRERPRRHVGDQRLGQHRADQRVHGARRLGHGDDQLVLGAGGRGERRARGGQRECGGSCPAPKSHMALGARHSSGASSPLVERACHRATVSLTRASLDWILINVVDGRIEMGLVPDESVPVFSLPERPVSSELLVGIAGSVSLPRTDCVAPREAPGSTENRTCDMIRHDRPSVKTITVAVESTECVLDESGNCLRL